ncbi:MAG: hypothetical protein Q4G24_13300 [Paracoccus sp. (in: a-proteobacteria)]|uniref:hypothetical protein n=1 Tax=Paracoccus sp. TaxID=267 RepID=UPI0026DF8D7A|nr:hypothetical protein [Paracoccus sp. (in: a-proteobacteria)]MDO5622435.1 hypothetical protein [Paracoccus sp. (in: a-proteobacteria)]
MQGYMFAHIETWSRQGGTKVSGTAQKYRRNRQRAWTAEEILDEAGREPWASEHVGENRREPEIWPGTCDSFDALRLAHEQAASVKLAFPYTDPKTGRKKTRRRALRKDAHTLYAAVFSLPVISAEALADPVKLAACRAVLQQAMAFERRCLEDAGGEFAMAALHLDEPYVHLHVYGLDRTRGSVNALHPGKAVNDAFRARHGALRRTGTTLADQARRAYCDAMREWQDDLHREVFADAGLMRFGPRRQRLSRAQYQQEKAAQEQAAAAQRVLHDISKAQDIIADIASTLGPRDRRLGEWIVNAHKSIINNTFPWRRLESKGYPNRRVQSPKRQDHDER